MIKISRIQSIFYATKLHFEENYNAFEYNFQLTPRKIKPSYHYEKLQDMFIREEDLIFFLFQTFTVFDIRYVGDLFSDEVKDNYKRALKIKEGLTYHFNSDIKTLSAKDLENAGKGILQKFLRGSLNIECLIILADIFDLFEMWKVDYVDDPFMSSYIPKIEKLKPLIRYDRSKITKSIIEHFNDIEL